MTIFAVTPKILQHNNIYKIPSTTAHLKVSLKMSSISNSKPAYQCHITSALWCTVSLNTISKYNVTRNKGTISAVLQWSWHSLQLTSQLKCQDFNNPCIQTKLDTSLAEIQLVCIVLTIKGQKRSKFVSGSIFSFRNKTELFVNNTRKNTQETTDRNPFDIYIKKINQKQLQILDL